MMTQQTELDRKLATWRRLEPMVLGVLPFGLLVLSTGISLVAPPLESWQRVLLLVLVLVTAAWLALGRLIRQRLGRAGIATFVIGQALLTVGLVALQPWFAFFTFVGYLNALAFLTGGRRFALIFVTAATMSTAQVGGVNQLHGAVWAVYGALVLVNTGLASAFGHYGDLVERQNEQRRGTIDELAAVNHRLESALADNAALQARLVAQARDAGIAEERRRMAREIHDTLAQGLAGIVTQLEAVGDGSSPDTGRRLELARSLARESLVEARRSVSAVQPAGLAGARLPEALAELGAGWQERTGVPAEVHVTGEVVALPAEAELALFRVAQESLTNVGKHARATRTVVTLSYLDSAVTLDIVDDGTGFDPEAVALRSDANGGFGMHTMRQRVEALAGDLQIESSADGTAVGVVLPRRDPQPTAEPAAAAGQPVGAGLVS